MRITSRLFSDLFLKIFDNRVAVVEWLQGFLLPHIVQKKAGECFGISEWDFGEVHRVDAIKLISDTEVYIPGQYRDHIPPCFLLLEDRFPRQIEFTGPCNFDVTEIAKPEIRSGRRNNYFIVNFGGIVFGSSDELTAFLTIDKDFQSLPNAGLIDFP